MAKRRHSLARRRRSLGATSGGSSMGWLLGIGALAAVLGGVWYWRSRSAAQLLTRIDCAIRNVTVALAYSRAQAGARLEQEQRQTAAYNTLLSMREAAAGRVAATVMDASAMALLKEWCPAPS